MFQKPENIEYLSQSNLNGGTYPEEITEDVDKDLTVRKAH